MKTLYVNINNEQIQSNEELEVLNYDLDSDFFFYLGEKIAKGCKVENENALITDFNIQDAAEDYQKIIAQWNEIKAILFSEECDDDYEFKLPAGYIHWLEYHPQYVSVYDKNFSQEESGIIYIDLEELYEESVESMQRRILRKLQRDDLYRDIDEIVFNDDAITSKSRIVRILKKKCDGIGFLPYGNFKRKLRESVYRRRLVEVETLMSYHKIDKYERALIVLINTLVEYPEHESEIKVLIKQCEAGKENLYTERLEKVKAKINTQKYDEAISILKEMLEQYPNHKSELEAIIRQCDEELRFGDKTYTVNGISFEMVAVKGGTFTMGATSEQGSDAYSNEKPTHKVTLSDYMIGKTEVTQELWKAVMGSNPSNFKGNNLPVENVSWHDCQKFIKKLNSLTGLNFRLPTEAEWEYAARGGNKSKGFKYSGSNNIGSVAWYTSTTNDSGTKPVATKSPNELGLYDMSGNVWEWCSDWCGDYSSSSQTNPKGPSSGSYRVFRGGSWGAYAGDCRVSIRNGSTPGYRRYYLGLRLAL